MDRKTTWLVPNGQRTAHALMKPLGRENEAFWCGIVRGQYEVKHPRKGEAKCKRCLACIRHAREASRLDGQKSRLIHPDGRAWEYAPGLAYAIWLAVPGVALRVAGDDRPVMPWEFFAARPGRADRADRARRTKTGKGRAS